MSDCCRVSVIVFSYRAFVLSLNNSWLSMRGIVRRCFAFASVTATATHLAYNGSCGARARADRIDHSPTTLTLRRLACDATIAINLSSVSSFRPLCRPFSRQLSFVSHSARFVCSDWLPTRLNCDNCPARSSTMSAFRAWSTLPPCVFWSA